MAPGQDKIAKRLLLNGRVLPPLLAVGTQLDVVADGATNAHPVGGAGLIVLAGLAGGQAVRLFW